MKTIQIVASLFLAASLSSCAVGMNADNATSPSSIGSGVESGGSIEPGSPVSISFPKPVDVSSINGDTFFLAIDTAAAADISVLKSFSKSTDAASICTDTSAAHAPAIISCAADGSSCTIEPESGVDATNLVICMVGICYGDGTCLTEPLAISVALRDSIGPWIKSLSPYSGQVGVAITSNVTTLFSESLGTPASSWMTISKVSDGSSVAGAISLSQTTLADDTLIFDPTSSLEYGTQYSATISTSIADAAGNSAGFGLSWRFTTESNPTYNIVGILDTSFNNLNGFLISSGISNFSTYGRGIAVKSSGEIIVGGADVAGDLFIGMQIWQYTESGVADAALNSSGSFKHVGLGAADDKETYGAQDIMLDANGDILIVGSSNDVNGAANELMTIWKYSTSGDMLDATFGNVDGDCSGGSGLTSCGTGTSQYTRGYAIAQDESANIYVTGLALETGWDHMALWKFDADGAPDMTFGGGDGHYVGAASTTSYDILAYSDKLLISGQEATEMHVWELNSDGTLSNTFGGGSGEYASPDASSMGKAVVRDASGNIYIGGYRLQGADNVATIWKLASDGSLTSAIELSALPSVINGMIIGSDGYLYATGRLMIAAIHRMALWRVDTAMTLDTSFATDGLLNIEGGASITGEKIVETADGRLAITGTTSPDGSSNLMILWKIE